MRLVTAALAVTVMLAPCAGAQVPSSAETPAAKGRQVFEQYKCLLCHSLEGKGGKLSVALDGVAERRDGAAMKRILLSPDKALAGSKTKVKMPAFSFKDGELDALVAYLRTLRTPAK